MLRRKRNSLTSGNYTLRDGKELWYVCYRWSGYAALEGEQLDECNCTLRDEKRWYCAGR
jgi:hypothetical protein